METLKDQSQSQNQHRAELSANVTAARAELDRCEFRVKQCHVSLVDSMAMDRDVAADQYAAAVELLEAWDREHGAPIAEDKEDHGAPIAEDKEDHGRDQAAAQLGSVIRLVDALTVDYDRLTELRDERENLAERVSDTRDDLDQLMDGNDAAATTAAALNLRAAIDDAAEWELANRDELIELEEAAGDCADEDDAREAIEQDALSVEIRTGWNSPGLESYDAEEYRIVLCTGGPHVEIRGDLGRHNEPVSAALYYQDWGTAMAEYYTTRPENNALLEYAAAHYFG